MTHEPAESEWKDVNGINSYALFMGYLSMAVKGMGFLVGLWTTVVLLGGFVSMLEKKDFWSLTVITLVQTAGVFDVFLNEKLRYAWKSFDGLFVTVAIVFRKEDDDDDDDSDQYWRALVGVLVLLVQALVIAIIMLPLALLYLFGLLVSTGLSMWRLIERDYGVGDGGGANLTPALNVLYSLALFQGVLFCYQSASYFAGKRLARVVADDYGFDKEDEEGRESVRDYMRKTKIGCEKDPSFVKERNLVTFAVELMKSKSSSADYVSGARILDKILAQEELQGQHALIRQLVGSASASQVMERLLQSLRSTSPLDRDVRVLAARIVAQLAGEISLASFPHGLRCISSLLDTTTTTTTKQQDSDSAPSGHYKELMVLGRVILHKLAAADELNCSAIGSNQDLVSKAMVPVTADLLHNIGHDAWSDIVAASLQLMFRLVALPGKAGDKLRSNKRAINTVEKILKCDKCNEKLHVLAIKILTQLPMEAPSTTDSKEKITKLLVDIFFTKENKDASTRQLAGEALAMLSDQSESNATIIFKASDTVVDDLKATLLDVRTKSGYRISAAEILEHLYICYTKEDDYLKKLTEAMKDVLPKMLKEILPSPPSKQGEKQAEKGTDATKFLTQDPEIGEGAVASKDSGNVNEQKDDINKKNVDRKLNAALLSLSAAIFEKLISNDTDLAQLANTIATGDSASSFAGKLKKLVEENSEPTANCLRILKIASRMIISLLKLEGSYPKAELESLMESLSKASKEMFELEAFMMFSSSDHSAMNPVSILGSQVKQAQGLLENKKEQNVATTPASTVNRNQLIQ